MPGQFSQSPGAGEAMPSFNSPPEGMPSINSPPSMAPRLDDSVRPASTDATLGQAADAEPMNPLTFLAAIAGSLGAVGALVFSFVKVKSAQPLAEARAAAEQMKVPAMSAVAALALTLPATAQDAVAMSPHSALDDR